MTNKLTNYFRLAFKNYCWNLKAVRFFFLYSGTHFTYASWGKNLLLHIFCMGSQFETKYRFLCRFLVKEGISIVFFYITENPSAIQLLSGRCVNFFRFQKTNFSRLITEELNILENYRHAVLLYIHHHVKRKKKEKINLHLDFD